MDFQTISAIVFIAALTILLIIKRKKLDIQKIIFPLLYIILYRSKFGLKFMKSFPEKYPRLVKFFASAGVIIGFIGMVFISAQLIYLFQQMLVQPDTPSGVAPVLPIPVKGAVYVPFFFWILSIFVIATVHEFAHGVVSNLYKVPVKTSGFAIFGLVLPIIPAAFVEPDERKLQRKPGWEQLSVFAAGPFANIVLGFIVLGLMLAVMNPLSAIAFVNDGVTVDQVFNGSAAEEAGISEDEIIMYVDGDEVLTVDEFTESLSDKSPGETISISTQSGEYDAVLNPRDDDSERGFLGVSVTQYVSENPGFVEKYGLLALNLIKWFSELFFWLFLLNIGIGLFNLLPLGIVDGGRMLQIALLGVFKNKKKGAEKVWKMVSLFFLFIVLFMVISSFF
ncbi:MAG: site-2 protease family protein [Nanoarchaeota archaeon]